jgi:hypothetical protein
MAKGSSVRERRGADEEEMRAKSLTTRELRRDAAAA